MNSRSRAHRHGQEVVKTVDRAVHCHGQMLQHLTARPVAHCADIVASRQPLHLRRNVGKGIEAELTAGLDLRRVDRIRHRMALARLRR